MIIELCIGTWADFKESKNFVFANSTSFVEGLPQILTYYTNVFFSINKVSPAVGQNTHEIRVASINFGIVNYCISAKWYLGLMLFIWIFQHCIICNIMLCLFVCFSCHVVFVINRTNSPLIIWYIKRLQ